MANNEESAIESADKKSLVDYIQVCCALGQRLRDMSPKVNELKLNGFKKADEGTVQRYLKALNSKERKEESTNHVLLRVINELSTLKIDDNSNIIVSKDENIKEVVDFDVALKQIFSKPENDITLDYINLMAGAERLLRPSLDLVLENTNEKNLRVCLTTDCLILQVLMVLND